MAFQVKIRTGVNAFQFLESKWEFKLNVHSRIGVVRQVVVVFETQFFGRGDRSVPGHTALFPGIVPIHFGARTHKELHFHLLEFAHSENELTRHDLIPESFPDLRYAKRNFLACGFLHILEIHKYALCGFRAQVQFAVISCVRHLCRKHQVELAYLGPIARAGIWFSNIQFFNQGLEIGHVVCFQGIGQTSFCVLCLLRVFKHPWICFTEHFFIE